MEDRFKRERRRKSFALHLTDKQFVAIAKVAIRAATLDTMIELTISQILKRYPKILQNAANSFSGAQNLDLIKEALISDLPNHRYAIGEFISEAKASRNERNDIIHRAWRLSEGADKLNLVQISHDKPEKIVRQVTEAGMLKLEQRLIDHVYELADWKQFTNRVLQFQHAASQGKPPPLGSPPIAPRTSAKDSQTSAATPRPQRGP